jgi:uncharacterized protein (AIM24 family)
MKETFQEYAPHLLPTDVRDETHGGTTYHIQGELVPSLAVELGSHNSVYFEHHVMLWKHPDVTISLKPVKGAIRRLLAGMQIFVTEAKGQGVLAFSRDGAGHIIAMHMKQGETLHVREHQFLAATSDIDYTFSRVKGFANILLGKSGFFIDHFTAKDNDGILWLHGYGNVFEKVLAAGESIDVEPGAWIYKDDTVRMETNMQGIATGLFASMNFITNRFTGPGRVGIQSMYCSSDTSTS